MKKILGLDLGTTSIGWAVVNEKETANEESSIEKIGVRVVPLTVDEQQNFEKGKAITTNAERTLKRSMRRNLQRYKLRREKLVELLKCEGWITDQTLLCEQGNRTTFETYRLRAKAATEEISLEQFARVLLMINKKRGYKSSRKAKGDEEGQLIDGMAMAIEMYNEGLTPGQYMLRLCEEGRHKMPDFYRSDLRAELDRVWSSQRTYHPDLLTDELKEKLDGCNGPQTWTRLKDPLSLVGIKRTTRRGLEQLTETCRWRAQALTEQMGLEELAIVLQDINRQCAASSGYLGNISDRSKELYFRKQTVGQYLMEHLDADPHYSLKNKVFYRQDYLDEFNTLWETQRRFHPELTEELKRDLRDITIFYQRPLRSQKGLIDYCEFESRQVEVMVDGKLKTKTRGLRVCPKSSPLFQEFRTWHVLCNLRVIGPNGTEYELDDDQRQLLADALFSKSELKEAEALKLIVDKPRGYHLNYTKLEGNRTNALLIEKGVDPEVLRFDATLEGKAFEQQPAYLLWHLLYSYEGDNSNTGNQSLVDKLESLFNFDRELAENLTSVVFEDGYGNLSAKAIRNILPHMKEGNTYDQACAMAKYNHSHSITSEENANRPLRDRLAILPKGSLRNPVVEKILNQTIHVVNQVMATYGRPDEIRVEMARELKKSAKQREKMTQDISRTTRENEERVRRLQSEFGIPRPSRNDILRLRLYEELAPIGFRAPYSGREISPVQLFSKEIDIEHIIPQARLFDDSFANKTLEFRDVNLRKSNLTALDYVEQSQNPEQVEQYRNRVKQLEGTMSAGKVKRLLWREADIPEGFLNRDLSNSQYIARKAMELLHEVCRSVQPTTGSITDRLRDDWQLTEVMRELNWDKYDAQGLTETFENRDGHRVSRIKDWTKRNDHRHHAMDALTIAFTNRSIVQHLNTLNARDELSPRLEHGRFPVPFGTVAEFRAEAKRQLESILVSQKAKNKVTTLNVNTTRTRTGKRRRIQLTPRGQLHNETLYGSLQQYVTKEEKVGSAFDESKIQTVANQEYRQALLRRLQAFGGDAKKAFTGANSLEKKPIFLNIEKSRCVPPRVKTVTLETIYTIRKDVTPDLKVDKVVDPHIRQILQARLEAYGGDPKKAFANLDENPIWLNQKQGIDIKRVTITGVSNAVALHTSQQGRPKDYVSTSNNHHVAIFRDAEGNLQEHVVSFFEATQRRVEGLPVIDKEYNSHLGWHFLFTMKQNEYFVFPNAATGFDPKEVNLLDPNNAERISPNLFRVQKFSSKDYFFRHHLETSVDCTKTLQGITWKRVTAMANLEGIVKVRVDHLGRIVSVGEY